MTQWKFNITVGYNRLNLDSSYYATKGSMIAVYLSGTGRIAINTDTVYPDYAWISLNSLERICTEKIAGLFVNVFVDIKFNLKIFSIAKSYSFIGAKKLSLQCFGNI